MLGPAMRSSSEALFLEAFHIYYPRLHDRFIGLARQKTTTSLPSPLGPRAALRRAHRTERLRRAHVAAPPARGAQGQRARRAPRGDARSAAAPQHAGAR